MSFTVEELNMIASALFFAPDTLSRVDGVVWDEVFEDMEALRLRIEKHLDKVEKQLARKGE